MLDCIKSRIPRSLKRIVRQSPLNLLQRQVTDWHLQQSVRVFRSSSAPDRGLIENLWRAWGNESWSADVTYVSEVVSRVGRSATDVLECGSGLTTLAAALVGEGHDLTIWSLEQDPEWVDFVSQRLRRYNIRNVKLINAPLRDYGGYVWYDIDNVDLPNHFELVLCDGPAVLEKWGGSYANWRYGILPVLAEKGIRVDEVLLDDATEPRAANLLLRWRTEFGMSHRMIQSGDGDCAVVTKVE